eukprot:CAMPEP_0175751056 /NCGR_PEP_ID=MMETSP0097-20121207/61012_1 /TAXON_ID=311494 /ORGANISM="Alexandrium monilatum, Strain CCMP3105" /LENGTH=111 /DNA_ID=CAMNT_0017059717 /DNA_START=101 /DNA_END=432 /DNA_ORIENTATION=-
MRVVHNNVGVTKTTRQHVVLGAPCVNELLPHTRLAAVEAVEDALGGGPVAVVRRGVQEEDIHIDAADHLEVVAVGPHRADRPEDHEARAGQGDLVGGGGAPPAAPLRPLEL